MSDLLLIKNIILSMQGRHAKENKSKWVNIGGQKDERICSRQRIYGICKW